MFYVKSTILIILCLIAESLLFSNIKIFGVIPDLLLIAVILIGILNGWKKGLVVGLIAGGMLDLLLGQYVGLDMMIYGAIGGGVAVFMTKYNLDNFLGIFISVLVSTMLAGIVRVLGVNILGGDMSYLLSFIGIIIPMCFYNLIITLITLPITGFIMRGRYFSRLKQSIVKKEVDLTK